MTIKEAINEIYDNYGNTLKAIFDKVTGSKTNIRLEMKPTNYEYHVL